MTSSILQDMYPVPQDIRVNAHIKSIEQYREMWTESVENPEKFWEEVAEEQLTWFEKWSRVAECNYGESANDLYIRWFKGGKLNVSFNCLDRHLETRADQVALIWEGNEPDESRQFTYAELHREVCRFANVLKEMNISKGDVVTFYLPMIPELAIGILACARIGAVHAVVFGGFSAEALANRIKNSGSSLVVSCDGTFRGSKVVHQKRNADEAIEQCDSVHKHLVIQRIGRDKLTIDWFSHRDVWYHEAREKAEIHCLPAIMDAEDPLFILYTSGSTGTPKGVLHTSGGYLTYASYTHKMVFDYHDGDVYWCTADIGWITGHSYIVYGPLCNGATTIMFEGVPSYPDFGRFWSIVEKYKVNIFYTAPTAIRALARMGDSWVEKYDLSSLRILGSVGEPLNPEAWNWYYQTVGNGKCPIVDTWWQTETGGIMISPLPGAIDIKPGQATLPFFGVQPAIVDENGEELAGECEGYLVLKNSWPGQMRSVYKNSERFHETYFTQFPGLYTTGDGCKRDSDGYYQITGRVDDVINVSGHRIGTAEIESALVSHPKVAEAAVVGYSHPIKGQSIYAFVTLNSGIRQEDSLKKDLAGHVRKEIGPIATPELIQYSDFLPKTRSGKIMRRILRQIASGDFNKAAMGDISTLADPSTIDETIEHARVVQQA